METSLLMDVYYLIGLKAARIFYINNCFRNVEEPFIKQFNTALI